MRHTARSNTAPPVSNKLSRSGGKGKETLEDLAGRHFGRQVEVVLLFCVLFWFGFVLVGLRGRCICQCILSRPPQTLLLRQKQKQNRSRDSGERKATSILLIYHALYPPDIKMRGCDTQRTGKGRDSSSIPVGLALYGWTVVRQSSTSTGGMTASGVEASCRLRSMSMLLAGC